MSFSDSQSGRHIRDPHACSIRNPEACCQLAEESLQLLYELYSEIEVLLDEEQKQNSELENKKDSRCEVVITKVDAMFRSLCAVVSPCGSLSSDASSSVSLDKSRRSLQRQNAEWQVFISQLTIDFMNQVVEFVDSVIRSIGYENGSRNSSFPILEAALEILQSSVLFLVENAILEQSGGMADDREDGLALQLFETVGIILDILLNTGNLLVASRDTLKQKALVLVSKIARLQALYRVAGSDAGSYGATVQDIAFFVPGVMQTLSFLLVRSVSNNPSDSPLFQTETSSVVSEQKIISALQQWIQLMDSSVFVASADTGNAHGMDSSKADPVISLMEVLFEPVVVNLGTFSQERTKSFAVLARAFWKHFYVDATTCKEERFISVGLLLLQTMAAELAVIYNRRVVHQEEEGGASSRRGDSALLDENLNEGSISTMIDWNCDPALELFWFKKIELEFWNLLKNPAKFEICLGFLRMFFIGDGITCSAERLLEVVGILFSTRDNNADGKASDSEDDRHSEYTNPEVSGMFRQLLEATAALTIGADDLLPYNMEEVVNKSRSKFGNTNESGNGNAAKHVVLPSSKGEKEGLTTPENPIRILLGMLEKHCSQNTKITREIFIHLWNNLTKTPAETKTFLEKVREKILREVRQPRQNPSDDSIQNSRKHVEPFLLAVLYMATDKKTRIANESPNEYHLLSNEPNVYHLLSNEASNESSAYFEDWYEHLCDDLFYRSSIMSRLTGESTFVTLSCMGFLLHFFDLEYRKTHPNIAVHPNVGLSCGHPNVVGHPNNAEHSPDNSLDGAHDNPCFPFSASPSSSPVGGSGISASKSLSTATPYSSSPSITSFPPISVLPPRLTSPFPPGAGSSSISRGTSTSPGPSTSPAPSSLFTAATKNLGETGNFLDTSSFSSETHTTRWRSLPFLGATKVEIYMPHVFVPLLSYLNVWAINFDKFGGSDRVTILNHDLATAAAFVLDRLYDVSVGSGNNGHNISIGSPSKKTLFTKVGSLVVRNMDYIIDVVCHRLNYDEKVENDKTIPVLCMNVAGYLATEEDDLEEDLQEEDREDLREDGNDKQGDQENRNDKQGEDYERRNDEQVDDKHVQEDHGENEVSNKQRLDAQPPKVQQNFLPYLQEMVSILLKQIPTQIEANAREWISHIVSVTMRYLARRVQKRRLKRFENASKNINRLEQVLSSREEPYKRPAESSVNDTKEHQDSRDDKLEALLKEKLYPAKKNEHLLDGTVDDNTEKKGCPRTREPERRPEDDNENLYLFPNDESYTAGLEQQQEKDRKIAKIRARNSAVHYNCWRMRDVLLGLVNDDPHHDCHEDMMGEIRMIFEEENLCENVNEGGGVPNTSIRGLSTESARGRVLPTESFRGATPITFAIERKIAKQVLMKFRTLMDYSKNSAFVVRAAHISVFYALEIMSTRSTELLPIAAKVWPCIVSSFEPICSTKVAIDVGNGEHFVGNNSLENKFPELLEPSGASSLLENNLSELSNDGRLPQSEHRDLSLLESGELGEAADGIVTLGCLCLYNLARYSGDFLIKRFSNSVWPKIYTFLCESKRPFLLKNYVSQRQVERIIANEADNHKWDLKDSDLNLKRSDSKAIMAIDNLRDLGIVSSQSTADLSISSTSTSLLNAHCSCLEILVQLSGDPRFFEDKSDQITEIALLYLPVKDDDVLPSLASKLLESIGKYGDPYMLNQYMEIQSSSEMRQKLESNIQTSEDTSQKSQKDISLLLYGQLPATVLEQVKLIAKENLDLQDDKAID